MSIDVIEHKGQEILYCNYSGVISETENMKQIERQMDMIEQSSQPVLLPQHGCLSAPARSAAKRQPRLRFHLW